MARLRVALCATLLHSIAVAQPDITTALTTREGLPQNTARTLTRDATGFVWIGTQDGLARYDGHSIRRYHERALGDDWVQALLAEENGRLWVGTRGGLRMYVPAEDRFLPRPSCGKDVQALAPSHEGRLWIGTADGGLCLLDPASGRLRRVLHEPVMALASLPSGGVWAGISGDVVFRIGADGRPAGHVVAGAAVRALHLGPSGGLWVGTVEGLCFAASDGEPCTSVVGARNVSVTALAAGPGGNVLVGTAGRGVLQVSDGQAKALGQIETGEILALLVGPGLRVWAGTGGQGVLTWDGTPRFATLAPPEGAPPTAFIVRAFAEVGGLWVGTGDGTYAMGEAGLVRAGIGPCARDPFVRALAVTDEALWVGRVGGGLCRLDPETGQGSRVRGIPGTNVYALLAASGGALWVGTESGLVRRTAEGARLVPLAEPPGEDEEPLVRALLERGEEIWVGTEGRGVVVLARDGRYLRRYRHVPGAPSLPSDVVYGLHADRQRAVWTSTDRGLARIEPEADRIARAPAFDDEATYAALADSSGALWVPTNRGLFRLDPATGRATPFTPTDGLPTDEFNGGAAYRAADGRFLFGTVAGAVSFRPATLRRGPFEAPVVLTGFEAYGSDRVHPPPWSGRPLALAPDEDDFAFEFAALHFGAPGRVRYAYRLDGLEDEWVEAGARRNVTYGNVPPGQYRFRVRAAWADGPWSPREATATVLVRAYWWETLWARLAALAMLTGGAWALVRWRRRTRTEAEQDRQRIADDLHDDLGGRLAAVALQVEVASRDRQIGEQARDRLTGAAGDIRSAAADLRDTIWAVDPDADTALALTERMEAVAHEALQTVPHRIEPAPPVVTPLTPDVRRAVLLAFREALHNALRHAADAPVHVQLLAGEGHVGFRITDEGPGFDPTALTGTGRGLRSMRERTGRIGGSFRLDAAPGRGTCVEVRVPYRSRRGSRTV